MSLTDPVADFLARIRNAIRARHQKLDVPASKLKTEIARILKEEGYIANYKTQEEDGKRILRVYLKYGGQEAAIRDLARISRPGCRVYIGRDEIRDIAIGQEMAGLDGWPDDYQCTMVAEAKGMVLGSWRE